MQLRHHSIAATIKSPMLDTRDLVSFQKIIAATCISQLESLGLHQSRPVLGLGLGVWLCSSTSKVLVQVLGHSKTVLVLLGGWAFLGDKVSGRQAFGMALAVAGMVAYGLASTQCGPLTGMVPPGFSPVRKSARLAEARARQRRAAVGAASKGDEAEGQIASAQLGPAHASTRHRR